MIKDIKYYDVSNLSRKAVSALIKEQTAQLNDPLYSLKKLIKEAEKEYKNV